VAGMRRRGPVPRGAREELTGELRLVIWPAV